MKAYRIFQNSKPIWFELVSVVHMAPTPEPEWAASMATLAVKPMLLVASCATGSSKPLRSGHPDQDLSLPSSCCPGTLSYCQEEHVLPQAAPCSSQDYLVSKSPSVKEQKLKPSAYSWRASPGNCCHRLPQKVLISICL